LTTGVIVLVSGSRIVYSAPPRVVARNVSYVVDWPSNAHVLTALKPPVCPVGVHPNELMTQRRTGPLLSP
jgi:hypothetical protein